MANKYHDELGRFCSRSEMGQAVERVFSAAAAAPTEDKRKELMQQWLEIKNDYDTALAKPETLEEKLDNFLAGEPDAKPAYAFDKLRLARVLLEDNNAPEKGANLQKLISQVDFSKIHPESADLKAVLASKYLTSEQSYQLAKRVKSERSASAGLIALASARYEVFLMADEREAELVRALKEYPRDDIMATRAWVNVARTSQSPSWRKEAAQLLIDEGLHYSYKPAAAYASNPHLSLSEATSGLRAVAAHSPRSFNTYIQSLAASTSTSLSTLHRHAELAKIAASRQNDFIVVNGMNDYKSDARFAASWQQSDKELTDQRARLAELELAGQAAAGKMTGPGSPKTAYEGMTLAQQTEYDVGQARVDANDLVELRKEGRRLRGSFDGFFNRNKSYREKEELRTRYQEVRDRIDAAQRYIYQNELAARLTSEINEEAEMYRRADAERVAASA